MSNNGVGVDMSLEVVTVPVSDVDRAKSFYESLGWRLDIDLVISDDIRNSAVHPTPLAVLDPRGQGPHARWNRDPSNG